MIQMVASASPADHATPARLLPRVLVAVGVSALMGAALLLWSSQGSAVFLEALASGLAWCL